MTTRVTIKQLERKIALLNEITGNPDKPWRKEVNENGVIHRANIGNYHLSGAYGGYKVERMEAMNGSTSDILNTGFTTKRELLNAISYFIEGIRLDKRA